MEASGKQGGARQDQPLHDAIRRTGAETILRRLSQGLDPPYEACMLARLSPGGVTKICILYDEQSDLFWLTANHPIDHLPDLGALRKRGFVGVPANERRIPNLYYSLDCFNWFQAGTVAMSRSQLESFSYPSMLIDNDDPLVLSRTSVGGKNQHDTNLVTLHRARGFRSLALDLHPS